MIKHYDNSTFFTPSKSRKEIYPKSEIISNSRIFDDLPFSVHVEATEADNVF